MGSEPTYGCEEDGQGDDAFDQAISAVVERHLFGERHEFVLPNVGEELREEKEAHRSAKRE